MSVAEPLQHRQHAGGDGGGAISRFYYINCDVKYFSLGHLSTFNGKFWYFCGFSPSIATSLFIIIIIITEPKDDTHFSAHV